MHTTSQAALPAAASPAAIDNRAEGRPAETHALGGTPLGGNPLDLPADTFREGLSRRKQNRAALMAWVRDAMIEGIDFGKIHVTGKNQCKAGKHCTNPAHFSKPSLFKPGAEKICGMLGVTVRYPTLPDYEKAALTGAVLSQIIIRCEIVDAFDRVVGDGVGARNVSQDYGDINKSLKMAEKSAHIDATLRMAGLSEVFTQDIEDMIRHGGADGLRDGFPAGGFQPNEARADTGVITAEQLQALDDKIRALGLDRKRVQSWMVNASKQRFSDFKEMTPEFHARLFGKLDQFAESAERIPVDRVPAERELQS